MKKIFILLLFGIFLASCSSTPIADLRQPAQTGEVDSSRQWTNFGITPFEVVNPNNLPLILDGFEVVASDQNAINYCNTQGLTIAYWPGTNRPAYGTRSCQRYGTRIVYINGNRRIEMPAKFVIKKIRDNKKLKTGGQAYFEKCLTKVVCLKN